MNIIMMPVLLLDKDCRECDELDVISEVKGRIYADDECVEQELQIRCKDVYKCQRLLKRLRKKEAE